MTGFRYSDTGGTKQRRRYEFACTKAAAHPLSLLYDKGPKHFSRSCRDGEVLPCLSETPVDCGPDMALTWFMFKKEKDGRKNVYQFGCAKPIDKRPGVEAVFTQCQEKTGRSNTAYDNPKNVDFLYKFEPQDQPQCSHDEVLQAFSMTFPGKFLEYKYRCCKIKSLIPPEKCHMSACATKAQDVKAAGFCLTGQDGGDCWLPTKTGDARAFAQEASSSGKWMGPDPTCREDIEGAKGMMACYGFLDKSYSTKLVNFTSQKDFDEVVDSALTNFNNFAWRITGFLCLVVH